MIKEILTTYLKGFCMGIADVIPGISGGTIAFIVGIYERLIIALKSFDQEFFKYVITFRPKIAFNHVDGSFLFPLLAGIATAIIALASLVSYLITYYPAHIYGFFFGLIVASIFLIAKKIKLLNPSIIITTLISATIAYNIFGLLPLQTPTNPWFIFLCGAMAICAMILPGISGSFILLILGKYQFILDAVHEHNIGILVVLMLGMIVGILSFVRIVSWCLTRFHDRTIAILLGLVIGSLRKIWPWKETLSFFEKKGKLIPLEQVNIFPIINAETILVIGLCILGCAIAFLLGQLDLDKNA